MTPAFTSEELDYLRSQRLGRLATVDPSGAPQNNPVGFVVDETNGRILIGGRSLGATRKFKNARSNPYVAFVVDDLASVTPWVVRGVEVRGTAETLSDVDPPRPGMSRQVLRITPTWVGSWGIDAARPGLAVRT
ncbi:MAG: PPOX class F420-dependent oxidoreductase [Nocardioidaceae bacterium]